MSGFLFEDLPQTTEGRIIWFGTIAETITEFNQRCRVIIPEISRTTQMKGCFWQARDGTSMPQRGNRCLIAFDNRRQPWVIAWWPFDT